MEAVLRTSPEHLPRGKHCAEVDVGRSTSNLRVNKLRPLPRSKPYQTRQTFSVGLTMGWPALQPKAWANSGMLTTTPLMR